MRRIFGMLMLHTMIVASILVSVSAAAPIAPPARPIVDGPQFLVRLMVVDSRDGTASVISRPYMVVVDNQVGKLSVGGTQVGIPGAGAKESINTALNLDLKVSALKGDEIRLDVSMARNSLQQTDKDKIRIVGHVVREIEVAKIGERIHLNLDDDSQSVYLTVVAARTAH